MSPCRQYKRCLVDTTRVVLEQLEFLFRGKRSRWDAEDIQGVVGSNYQSQLATGVAGHVALAVGDIGKHLLGLLHQLLQIVYV